MTIAGRGSRIACVATALLWILASVSSAGAAATLAGHWFVRTTSTLSFFDPPLQFSDRGTWDFAVNGSSIGLSCTSPLAINVSCPDTGAIDVSTGTVTLPPPPPCTLEQCLAVCPFEACELNVAACPYSLDCFLRSVCDHAAPTLIVTTNGRSFRGSSDYQTLLDPQLHCGAVHVDIFGSRCNDDGHLDPDEECDDGNTVDGDGCDTNCTVTRCGNGIVSPGEQCDDGNSDGSDGCKNDCTANVCGDGVLQTGVEECDDGNLGNNDGCSSSCKVELIAGGGPVATDCLHEWATTPIAQMTASGRRRHRIECTDDDPGCDFGALSGDGACTFHVAMCFNVPTSGSPCPTRGVHTVRVLQPNVRHADETSLADRTALEGALSALSGRVQGACSNRGANAFRSCASNSDCDSSPGAGDGRCPRLFEFTMPYTTAGGCSNVASVTVPLRHGRRGKLTLSLDTAAASTAPAPIHDRDKLTLVCNPH